MVQVLIGGVLKAKDVVHRIVESHNGGIEVQSNTGEGTTFYIYLPVVAEPVAV